MAARDGQGAVPDGVEIYSVAYFAGELEEGGDLLVTFGAVYLWVNLLSHVGRESYM